MNYRRIARNVSAGTVAGIAGYASYWHQVAVAQSAGEREELAHIMPLSVDGLLVVASIAMVDARAEGRRPSWKTKVAFAVGIAASVGANVMSAQPTLLGRIVAGWPALALLLVVETLASRGKRLRDDAKPERVAATPEVVVQAQQVVAAEESRLPVPVSPAAPVFSSPHSPERVTPDGRIPGTGPVARRASKSPLTGEVLMERAPRV
jgi:hypothetical protein